MLCPVSQDQKGSNIYNCVQIPIYCAAHCLILPSTLTVLVSHRPNDRVPLKDMKDDWHACLNNKLGFKVVFSLEKVLNFEDLFSFSYKPCKFCLM